MAPILICVAFIGLLGTAVTGVETPVIFRIKLSEALGNNLKELVGEDGDREMESKIETMQNSLSKLNKNLDLAQDVLYMIQDMVGIILAEGSKFSQNFYKVRDQFVEQPENLRELRKKVNKLAELLPGFTSTVQKMYDAGLETDEVKNALAALKTLQTKLLKENVDAVEALRE